MKAIEPFDEDNLDRRRFIGAAAVMIAAANLDLISDDALASEAVPSRTAPSSPGASASFGPLKQIDGGLLNVGYVELGPAAGYPVILLNGWPYDVYSFAEVAPLLATQRYRVIVPYLRGYGTTRFLSSGTFRNGQPSALAN